MKELFPCPHCGGKALDYEEIVDFEERAFHRVTCQRCGMSGPIAYLPEVAGSLWNELPRHNHDAGIVVVCIIAVLLTSVVCVLGN